MPLQRPPPGQVPVGVWSAATYRAPGDLGSSCALAFGDNLSGVRLVVATTFGGRFRLVGRAVFLALRYNPQALQMINPWGDLLQRGVLVVLQLLDTSLDEMHDHSPQKDETRVPANLSGLAGRCIDRHLTRRISICLRAVVSRA